MAGVFDLYEKVLDAADEGVRRACEMKDLNYREGTQMQSAVCSRAEVFFNDSPHVFFLVLILMVM